MERVYKQIRVALQKYRRDHPAAKLSIIAHSFGAYVGGEIVKRGFDIKIRLGLLGSDLVITEAELTSKLLEVLTGVTGVRHRGPSGIGVRPI